MTIGLFYREHQFIQLDNPDTSLLPQQQLMRLRKFVKQWKLAAARNDVIVMGDINLDFLKWQNPDNNHSAMVQTIKDEIETLGFHQQVDKTFTRSMPGQPETTIDHIWTNSPGRLIFCKNLPRTFSDHNLLWTAFRTKEKVNITHDFRKRVRSNLDLDRYRTKMSQIDWTELYQCENLEV